MKRQLSTKDWELLSSYLDDALNPREKTRVEALLSTRPEYKEALDGLHRTKSILHRARVRKVPHNFTLTAADVQPVRVPRWLPTMQWSSAAVALVAVFLFVSQLIPGLAGGRDALVTQSTEDSQLAAPEMAAQPMAAAPASATAPEVIYWGGPPAAGPAATGLGGGGGGGDGLGGGGVGGPMGGGIDAAVTENPFPQPPIPNSLPDLQPKSAEAARITAKEPVTGTGPILGVKPVEQQGETLAKSIPASTRALETESQPVGREGQILLIAAGVLLIIAFGLMITAILIRRNMLR